MHFSHFHACVALWLWQLDQGDDPDKHVAMQDCFQRLQTLQGCAHLGGDTRFKVLDVLKLRESQWAGPAPKWLPAQGTGAPQNVAEVSRQEGKMSVVQAQK